MSETQEFSFGGDSVASAYDNALVPILFEPWAARLVEEHRPWEGQRVLDLATGTGIVAQLLAEEVGPGGKVLVTDINGEMLALARKRCAGHNSTVIPRSNVKVAIVRVLKQEGFIDGYIEDRIGPQGRIKVFLKYDAENRGSQAKEVAR